MKNDEMIDLAEGLQHSNFKEVSQLAKSYLVLSAQFEQLYKLYVDQCSKNVLDKHANLFKRLKESGD